MGAADGVSAAPAPTTGQQFEWRRTPITSQSGGNGTVKNPDSVADKEFQSSSSHVQQYQVAPVWDTLFARVLKEDWNRMAEAPMPGFESYGFKELVRIGPKLLGRCGPVDFMRGSRPGGIRCHVAYPDVKNSFLDGPVFRECVIDPKMFHKLSLSSSDDHPPFEEFRSVEDDETRSKNSAPVGGELKGPRPVKVESRIVIDNTVPAKQVIGNSVRVLEMLPVTFGYQPNNLDAEFPNLGGASTSVPKDQVAQRDFVGPKYSQKKKGVRQWAFDFRNKRDNLISKHYLNSQLEKVLEDKKPAPMEKTESAVLQNPKPFLHHHHKGFQPHKKHRFQKNFVPQQPVVFLRREHVPMVPVVFPCVASTSNSVASSVVSKEGITNNFQASHGYRQWKRAKEEGSTGTSNTN